MKLALFVKMQVLFSDPHQIPTHTSPPHLNQKFSWLFTEEIFIHFKIVIINAEVQKGILSLLYLSSFPNLNEMTVNKCKRINLYQT